MQVMKTTAQQLRIQVMKTTANTDTNDENYNNKY